MKVIIVLAAAIMLSSCDQGPAPILTVSDGGGSADVKIITLPDGTRCAVLIGYSKAAISCDWKPQVK